MFTCHTVWDPSTLGSTHLISKGDINEGFNIWIHLHCIYGLFNLHIKQVVLFHLYASKVTVLRRVGLEHKLDMTDGRAGSVHHCQALITCHPFLTAECEPLRVYGLVTGLSVFSFSVAFQYTNVTTRRQTFRLEAGGELWMCVLPVVSHAHMWVCVSQTECVFGPGDSTEPVQQRYFDSALDPSQSAMFSSELSTWWLCSPRTFWRHQIVATNELKWLAVLHNVIIHLGTWICSFHMQQPFLSLFGLQMESGILAVHESDLWPCACCTSAIFIQMYICIEWVWK